MYDTFSKKLNIPQTDLLLVTSLLSAGQVNSISSKFKLLKKEHTPNEIEYCIALNRKILIREMNRFIKVEDIKIIDPVYTKHIMNQLKKIIKEKSFTT